MPSPKKCEICGGNFISEEDWDFGRISICEQGHFRKVERFDKPGSTNILDKQEKGDKDAA